MGVTEGTGPVPPDPATFSQTQADDFYAGQQLIRTFVATYQGSKTGLGAEIVNYYRTAEQAIHAKREWFVNSRKLNAPPPIDARSKLAPTDAARPPIEWAADLAHPSLQTSSGPRRLSHSCSRTGSRATRSTASGGGRFSKRSRSTAACLEEVTPESAMWTSCRSCTMTGWKRSGLPRRSSTCTCSSAMRVCTRLTS